MTTTHIIEFTANAIKPPLTVITEPDSIYTGDKITIRLYSAHDHDLISPYKGLGSKSSVVLAQQDEIVDLSGGGEVSAKYPIKTLVNLIAALPIVDETSRSIVVEAEQKIPASLIRVINQRLIVADGYKLHGSIRIVYDTFTAQVWTHEPFTKKGSPVLFAHNLTTQDYENVPLSINERTNNASDSIKIDFWDTPLHANINPYHHVIVYPARKNPLVKTDIGTVTKKDTVTNTIKRESINFSGKEANAAFYIDNLVSFTGYFFDGKGHEITPDFHVNDGKLIANVDCYGTGFLTYKTQGIVYQYDAKVTITPLIPAGIDTKIEIGNIYAFDRDKLGIAASYAVPEATNVQQLPRDFCTIYSKIIVQPESKVYEYPPNWPNDNVFPSLPTPGPLPVVDESISLVAKRVHAIGKLYAGGTTDIDSPMVTWLSPYDGVPNLDLQLHIEQQIPTDASDYEKETMQKEIDKLKDKYGIA